MRAPIHECGQEGWMKGYGRVGVAALAVAAVAGLAPAQASALSLVQSVTGSGTSKYPTPLIGPGQVTVTLTAQTGLLGAGGLTGTAQVEGTLTGTAAGDFTAAGSLTCIVVQGKSVSYEVRFSSATGAAVPFQGGGMAGFVRDNGSSGDQAAPGVLQLPATFNPTGCADPSTGAYQPLVSGDYTVNDVQLPLLTLR
jgi:hypothetical protein